MHITLSTGTPAYRADSPHAERGVVVIPDIGGVRPLFTEICDRLAAENGWSVMTFEPWPGREQLPLDERLASVGTLDDEAVLGDVAAAAGALGVDPVGAIGFCMGGMFAIKAATLPEIDRAVSFYGMVRLPEQWRSPTMRDALDVVTQREAGPILLLTGTDDPYVPPADADALEQTGAEVVRYQGAEHGFVHDPTRDAHRPDDAADAWRRTVAFLRGTTAV